jgi:hypothetical protein
MEAVVGFTEAKGPSVALTPDVKLVVVAEEDRVVGQ